MSDENLDTNNTPPETISELEQCGFELLDKLQQLSLELRRRVYEQRNNCQSLSCEIKSLLGVLNGGRDQ
jgi:hypothetical protein